MRRALVVAVLGLACFLAPMAAAYGLWTASATGTMTVSTAGTTLQPPAAPTLACGSSPRQGDYSLTWSSVATATSYTVYRSIGGNTNADYAVLASGATSPYNTTGAPGQSTYYYRVKATNGAGDSVYSNTVAVTRSGSAMNCAGATP